MIYIKQQSTIDYVVKALYEFLEMLSSVLFFVLVLCLCLKTITMGLMIDFYYKGM
jgi:hypothetical protein